MLIECVPNFSEGRNPAVIASLTQAIAAHVPVLDVTSDRDHNRTVITFAGDPQAVERAAFDAARQAVASIDLRQHTGVHPRIGAIDVIPFVPLSGAALEDCAAVARRLAHRLWDELQLPSFLYECAAEGRPLEAVRRAAKAGAAPDIGEGRHATAGAAVVGARRFLVAWNIWLDSTDLQLAKQIAKCIRQPGVKALGFPLEERNCVQVSINSTDFESVPLQTVFDSVAQRCREAAVAIQGAELIGMIPEQALNSSHLPWLNLTPSLILPFSGSR